MNTGNKPRLWIRTVIRRHYERVGKTFRIEFWVWRFDHFGFQLVVTLLGLVYRLAITNIDGFGDVVNGYYNAGFQIYTLLLALSSVGIPSATSKLVARAETAGNQRRSGDVFRTAMALFFGIGLLSAAALYLGADLTACFVIQMDGGTGDPPDPVPRCPIRLPVLRLAGILPWIGVRKGHRQFSSGGTAPEICLNRGDGSGTDWLFCPGHVCRTDSGLSPDRTCLTGRTCGRRPSTQWKYPAFCFVKSSRKNSAHVGVVARRPFRCTNPYQRMKRRKRNV